MNLSAGVSSASVTFWMRMPGSIRSESATPVTKQMAATPAKVQFVFIPKTPTTEHHCSSRPWRLPRCCGRQHARRHLHDERETDRVNRHKANDGLSQVADPAVIVQS